MSGRRRERSRRRSVALAVLAVSALGVLALSVEAAGHTRGDWLDRRLGLDIYELLNAHRGVTRAVYRSCGTVPLMCAAAFIAAVSLLRRRPALAVTMLATPLLAVTASDFALKPLVDKRLAGTLAFPSGRATAIFSVALAACYALIELSWRRFPRAAAVTVGVIVAYAVLAGMSVVMSGDHYATDVIAGAGVATATLAAWDLARSQLVSRRRGKDQSRAVPASDS